MYPSDLNLFFTILYITTLKEYQIGYDIFHMLYPEVKFVRDSNFREDLINLTYKDYKYTLYLVDDCFFTSDIVRDSYFNTFDIDNSIMAMSLIKSKDNKYISDNMNELCGQPDWIDDHLWRWRQETGIWNYAMSVSMTMYRTKDLYSLLSSLQFNNANELEDAMIRNPIDKPFMLSSGGVKIANIDVNIVYLQSNVTDVHLSNGQDTGTLNDRWLNDFMIDDKPLNNLRRDTYQFLTTKFDFEKR